jgi:hypothetical protein
MLAGDAYLSNGRLVIKTAITSEQKQLHSLPKAGLKAPAWVAARRARAKKEYT